MSFVLDQKNLGKLEKRQEIRIEQVFIVYDIKFVEKVIVKIFIL